MKNKIMLILLVLVLASFLISSIGYAKSDKPTIGMIVPTMANEFWVRLSKFAELGAEQLGAELIVLDSRDSAEVQIANAEDLISRGVDGLIFVAYWQTGRVILNMTENAGIPTMVMDTYVEGVDPQTTTHKQYIAFMGPSNLKAGEAIAEYLINNVKKDGKIKMVALLGTLGTSVAEERRTALHDTLAKYPNVELLAEQTAEFRRDTGMKVMEDFLAAHKEIDVVWNANDEMALGAIMAIKNAGRQDEIIVGGMDMNDEAIEAVINGDYAYTCGGHWLQGGFLVTMMYDYLRGHDIPKDQSYITIELPGVFNQERANKMKEKYLPYPKWWNFKEHSKEYNPDATAYHFILEL